ncbi:ribosome silencing factor [bacterium]|nr:ribosome silencing factor [bacterium]
MHSINLAKKIARLAYHKQAIDIRILDLRGLTSAADFFIICSGSVDIHVRAITDFIIKELRPDKIRPYSIEGTDTCRWVLTDYIDVIFHCFLPESRDYFNLEGLWADAPVMPVDPVSGRITTLTEAKRRRQSGAFA